MLVPFSGPPTGITDAPVDLLNNYRHLKKLINRALKEGTPLEDLHLIEKHPSKRDSERDFRAMTSLSCSTHSVESGPDTKLS